ncbi:MAG: TRAP transporter substrate-binding protein DctP [Anaerolineales bacterium]|nr:TRAP transporter substrate-binding protein DctP [Anaerolineales bacterium]
MKRRMWGLVLLGALTTFSFSQPGAATWEWRYYSIVGTTHPYGKIQVEMLKRIEERTQGRLKIRHVSYGETPYKASDAPTVLRDGLGEMSDWLIGYSTSTYPLLSGPELPFLPVKPESPDLLLAASDKAWGAPAIQKELSGILSRNRVVAFGSYYWPPQNYWWRKPFNSAGDFRGLRLREFSAEGIDFARAVGAVPVSLTAPEVYSALQRGVVDGVITSASTLTGLKWGEVLSHGYVANVKLVNNLMLTSSTAFAKLPDDVGLVLKEEVEAGGKALRKFMVEDEARILKELKEKYGMTLVLVDHADYGALRKIAQQEVWAKWIERVGPEGKSIINSVLEALNAPERF